MIRNILALCCLITILQGCSDPDDVPASHISSVPAPQPAAAPEIKKNPIKNAYFGDLHVHTSWSMDAYAGENRLGPNTAYRFARGEAVELPTGIVTQLDVPLDFMAVTDHAEGFGTHLDCTIPGSDIFNTDTCRSVRSGDLDQQALLEVAFERGLPRPALRTPGLCDDVDVCLSNAQVAWQLVQETANAFNDPGNFTTLIGYEFSSLLPDFGMLHRNVIFRGDEVIPHAISSQDVVNIADFFQQLDAACEAPCEVLTIPHNTNYSWGLTVGRLDEDGTSYTDADLERRARLDRIFEVTQQKGTSECQLGVGAADEDCDFELMFPPCAPGQDTKCTKPSSMWRNILLDGLAQGEERAINPNKFGVIGSTDTHVSDPGNARGAPAQVMGAAGVSFFVNRLFQMEHIVVGAIRKMSGGGLAAVWAESNTRDDIFDALRRKEAFATSGSRLQVRFFGGDLPGDIDDAADPVKLGYRHGVPMGGDLIDVENPLFWVWAAQDPLSPKLDRIQIVKGWIENGEPMQKVWDVVCADGRSPGDDGQCPDTPGSVDLSSCEASGHGAGELQVSFTDPDYSAEVPAFYYARVFENPSCRWTTVLANDADVDPPEDVPVTVQQRAWSSPIYVGT